MRKTKQPSAPSGPEKYTLSNAGDQATVDRHDLYQRAVQHPPGDIYWMTKFYSRYISLEAPRHLREDFCGTAYLSSTWCKQDVCRTATGVDIDAEVLHWAMQHNVGDCSERICLIQANVLQPSTAAQIIHPQQPKPQQQQQQQQQQRQLTASSCAHPQHHPEPSNPRGPYAASTAAPPQPITTTTTTNTVQPAGQLTANSANHSSRAAEDHRAESPQALETVSSYTPDHGDLIVKPCDVICAFNFSVCLLHKRHEVLQYFRNVLDALCVDRGGLFIMDLMGGHAVEAVRDYKRIHFKTGIRYTFEQERYNPLTRIIRCHLHLRDPKSKKVLKRAFTYNWRLWSVIEVVEMLKEAGFSRVHVWAKPKGSAELSEKFSTAEYEDQTGADRNGMEDRDEYSAINVDEDDLEAELAPYVEYNPSTASTSFLNQLAKGWTAYVVGVLARGLDD